MRQQTKIMTIQNRLPKTRVIEPLPVASHINLVKQVIFKTGGSIQRRANRFTNFIMMNGPVKHLPLSFVVGIEWRNTKHDARGYSDRAENRRQINRVRSA